MGFPPGMPGAPVVAPIREKEPAPRGKLGDLPWGRINSWRCGAYTRDGAPQSDLLQTVPSQGIIRMSVRADICAGTVFAVLRDYAVPNWLSGSLAATHSPKPSLGGR